MVGDRHHVLVVEVVQRDVSPTGHELCIDHWGILIPGAEAQCGCESPHSVLGGLSRFTPSARAGVGDEELGDGEVSTSVDAGCCGHRGDEAGAGGTSRLDDVTMPAPPPIPFCLMGRR